MLTLLRRATLFAGAAALVLPATRKVAAQPAPVAPGSVVVDPPIRSSCRRCRTRWR